MKRLYIPYNPRPLQKTFHDNAKRFSAAVCHRRFGKTVMAAVNQLLRRILSSTLNRLQGAYIAPTLGQVKRIAWSYFRQFAGAIPGARFNETELRIDLPGGQRIWLLGAEVPDRLRGLYLDYVVFDEYADINHRLYPEIICPALAERNGGALWLGTPRGFNHFFDIYEAARSAVNAQDPEWFACVYKASKTGVIAQSELDAAASDMSDEQYAQEFEWPFNAAITGSYYGRLLGEAENSGRIGDFEWLPLEQVHTAWDLGISDSTAFWFFKEKDRCDGISIFTKQVAKACCTTQRYCLNVPTFMVNIYCHMMSASGSWGRANQESRCSGSSGYKAESHRGSRCRTELKPLA